MRFNYNYETSSKLDKKSNGREQDRYFIVWAYKPIKLNRFKQNLIIENWTCFHKNS